MSESGALPSVTMGEDGVLELRGSGEVSEDVEHRLVAERGGRGFLARLPELVDAPSPARPLHGQGARRTLVVVHGVKDAPSALVPLARALATRGFEPQFFLYDDLGAYLDRSGDDLARSLSRLACDKLALVAHSMGGIVARCALNSLVDPGWFPELHAPASTAAPFPVKGTSADSVRGIRLDAPAAHRFARVACVTIDTPWHGFKEPRFSVRDRLHQEGSFVDMVGNSALLTSLHDTQLPAHITIDYLEAHNEAAGKEADKVVGLGELDDEQASAILETLLAGEGDTPALRALRPTLRNYVRALRAEADFPELLGALRAARAAGQLGPSELRGLAAHSVPRFAGCHMSVLELPELWAEVQGTLEKRLSGLSSPSR